MNNLIDDDIKAAPEIVPQVGTSYWLRLHRYQDDDVIRGLCIARSDITNLNVFRIRRAWWRRPRNAEIVNHQIITEV